MSDYRKFLDKADEVALASEDPSTKVGAAIFDKWEKPIAYGNNDIADYIPYKKEQLEDRQWKYPRVIHAEQKAIFSGLFNGVLGLRRERNLIAVSHMPCERCASMIAHVGIECVVTRRPAPELLERWPGMKVSEDILKEAGIKLVLLDL